MATVISTLVVGCVPVTNRYVSAPGAVGRVVDGDARTPVAGAVVAVSRNDSPPAEAHTRKDGAFRIRAQHRWFVRDLLHPCKHVFVSSSAVMTVEHKSYHTFTADIPHGTEVYEAGEVRLYKVTK